MLWEWRSWRLTGTCVGGKAEARNLAFFRAKWLLPAMEATSCVRWVRLRSFQGQIGSPSVFRNEWLFMCAWFYSFVDSLVADRNVMAASRLLGATAACVILLSLADGHRKSYWNGCIMPATMICQQILSILALAIFLLKILLKVLQNRRFSALASRSGFGAAIFDAFARSSTVFCNSVSADRIVMAASTVKVA